tara:strand:+ start:3361 stop:3831 length:471 start_codon:yes stop_codon:yes gene_type:complete
MFAEIGLAVSAIKVANEAMGSIKELCTNIHDIKSVGSCLGRDLTKLSDAMEDLEKNAEKGDSEAFWALEELKQKSNEIKTLMVYGGRANLWTDYQTFLRNRKEMREKARKRELAKKLAKKKAIKDGLLVLLAVFIGCLTVGLGIWLLLAIISMKGR